MEISPVIGIRAMPVVKAPPAEPGLSAIFDIENPARSGDDSYSGSGKKAPGGQDDEPDESEESATAESADQVPVFGGRRSISYFA